MGAAVSYSSRLGAAVRESNRTGAAVRESRRMGAAVRESSRRVVAVRESSSEHGVKGSSNDKLGREWGQRYSIKRISQGSVRRRRGHEH